MGLTAAVLRGRRGNTLHILLVGDEAALPAELAEFIHAWGEQWEVTRAADGNAAVAELASSPIDALIVAPHVVGLPPTMLLLQARTLRPEAIRIALVSEQHAGRPPSARLIGLAHRFLPSPLAPESLLEALSSVEELRELLDSEHLRNSIGRIEKLPSPPTLYLRLTEALEQDDAIANGQIADLVAADPAIAAKVLQLSNSVFFNSGRTITDLRTAVTRLGLGTLRDLVLASEVFSSSIISEQQRAHLQQRAMMSARLASRLLPASSAELGATAALLADIGLLLPGVVDQRHVGSDSDALGHADAGAYLLGLWGLPMPIIEAVAFQLSPQRCNSRSFWVTGAVHVANSLIRGEPVNTAYLQQTGSLDKLPQWQQQADALLGLAANPA